MKTPDEIKKGLEYCSKVKGKCKDCPCYSDSECSIHLAADALAYIKQLEAAQPKWISVRERLPEDGAKVIAVGLYGNIHTAIHLYENTYEREDVPGDYGYFSATHWMPLPEMPKEE